MIPKKNIKQKERVIFEQISEKIEPIVFSPEELEKTKDDEKDYMYYDYEQNFSNPKEGFWVGTYKAKNFEEELENNKELNTQKINVSAKKNQLSLGKFDRENNFGLKERGKRNENLRIKSQQKQSFTSPFKKEWILSTDKSKEYDNDAQNKNFGFNNEILNKNNNNNYKINYRNNEQKINKKYTKNSSEIQPRRLINKVNYLEKNNCPETQHNTIYRNVNIKQNYNPQTTNLQNNKFEERSKRYAKLLNENQGNKYNNKQTKQIMPKPVLYENSEKNNQSQGIEKYYKRNILNTKLNQKPSYNLNKSEKIEVISGNRSPFQSKEYFDKNRSIQITENLLKQNDQNKNLSKSVNSKIQYTKNLSTQNETTNKKPHRLFKNIKKNEKMTQSVRQITMPNKFNFNSQNSSININSPIKKMIRNTFSNQDKFNTSNKINQSQDTLFTTPSTSMQKKIFQNKLSQNDSLKFLKNTGYDLNNTASTTIGLSPLLRESLQNFKDENISSKIVCQKFFESLDNGEISQSILDNYAEEPGKNIRDSYYRFSLSKIYNIDSNNNLKCTLKSINTTNGDFKVSYSEIKE